jgi:hypothetical protein
MMTISGTPEPAPNLKKNLQDAKNKNPASADKESAQIARHDKGPLKAELMEQEQQKSETEKVLSSKQ